MISLPLVALRLLLLLPVPLVFVQAVTSSPSSGNNLDDLIRNEELKFVFVGGKGGVGKTTSSSAIAAQLSLSKSDATKSNKRILLISTDPAHSLSDAWRMKFSNIPTPIMPDLPNLEVMEVNPTETMKKELSTWAELAKELGYDPSVEGSDGAETSGGIGNKIHAFQEWLSGIPGIDEATALSSAIEHIESGRYDMIVFDTAPTGHTLKLLELPGILQVGLDKLESWQATLWGYWEMVKGIASGGLSSDTSGIKEKVATKLRDYKASIGRVASMIKDKARTRFVVVCIAEFLSISETRRLLGELDRFDVMASHVVVNQLVTDFLEDPELTELEGYVSSRAAEHDTAILQKALAAARLTTARRNIQRKYLHALKDCPEVNRQPDPEDPAGRTNRRAGNRSLTVLEVPLLPSEVTGPRAILGFSHHIVGRAISEQASKFVAVEGERSRKARLAEKAQKEEEVRVASKLAQGKQTPGTSSGKAAAGKTAGKGDLNAMAQGLIAELMKDPELMQMINENPKLVSILEEVKSNPMAALKYMADPDSNVQKFLSKAMGKITGGPMRKRRRRRRTEGASSGGEL
mmetsp:Transcript_122974/g.244690  ORF Transcript_122974/g.244690 Transcript_122974/m.244690 type:complete len:577 (+) Transcript_122974:54-1784(+)